MLTFSLLCLVLLFPLVCGRQGVIVSLKETEGVIKRQDDTELAFETKENFSDVEFTQEDINEEVEFTIIQVRPLADSGRRRH